MFEKLKKKTFKKSIFATILLIAAGIGLMWFSWADAFYTVTGYVDFVQLAPDEIKPGQVVELDLTTNFGCYLEEYEVNTDTNRRTTTDLYYVLWTGDDDATDFRYMVIKVPASYEQEMEDMAENTYNELLSDPIYFCGKIRQMDEEEYSYFEEYFLESGWTEEEFKENTLPYYIDCYDNKTSMMVMFTILFVAAAALFVCGVCRLINGMRGGFLKQLRRDIENAGYTDITVEADYERAFSYTKKGDIKVGRLMTYYINGCTARAIPNNKIQWAYQSTTTHRRNGIKTGTTYDVIIAAENEKKFHILSVPSEAVAHEILQKMRDMFPWVVLGYSEQLRDLYNKNRSQFLDLCYNTCEHVAVEPGLRESASPAESE